LSADLLLEYGTNFLLLTKFCGPYFLTKNYTLKTQFWDCVFCNFKLHQLSSGWQRVFAWHMIVPKLAAWHVIETKLVVWCLTGHHNMMRDCYFTSMWCVIYQLDFRDKWMFFELQLNLQLRPTLVSDHLSSATRSKVSKSNHYREPLVSNYWGLTSLMVGLTVEGYHSFKVNSKYSLKKRPINCRHDTNFWSFSSFSWPLLSLIFVDLHGSIGPNNPDITGLSQLKIVKLCTRTMSFSDIFVHKFLSTDHFWQCIGPHPNLAIIWNNVIPNGWNDKRR